MTNEEINIAIAEACGWKLYQKEGELPWLHPNGKDYYRKIPNYIGDLNAIHEAETYMSSKLWNGYFNKLYKIVFNTPDQPEHINNWRIINATAAQRAEAFLRTIGKWKE